MLIAQSGAVNFADGSVWKLVIQFAVLFGAVLLGNILRTTVPFLRKMLIPSALLGGIIVLCLKLIPQVNAFLDAEFMQIVTYHCLGLGFAAMALKTEKHKKSVSTVKIVESGALMAGSYLLQALVGLIISLIFYYLSGSYFAAGLILPMGYGQGTGSALSWGSNYENNNGFAGGASYGLAVAAIGFLVGSVVGVIYMNVLNKKGKVRPRLSSNQARTVEHFEGENEIPETESVDKMSVQICLVIAAYAAAYGFMQLLQLTGIKALGEVAWGLNFLWALLFAFLLKLAIGGLKKKNVIKRNYVNNNMMDRISGLMFDIMIVAGVVAIDFEDIAANLPLLVVTCVIGAITTFIYVRAVTNQIYPGYELEGFLTNFGTVTGTASTGMILLREIDPDYVTPAATNIVLQNIPSIALLAPLLLTLGYAGSDVTHTYVMFGVYFLLFAAYNVFLFRKKIFKKHYASRPETPWSETDVEQNGALQES